jgi:hypothetical protein
LEEIGQLAELPGEEPGAVGELRRMLLVEWPASAPE